MMRKNIYFIGPFASGKNLIGGDCLKNWHLLRQLQKLSLNVHVIDTNSCRKSIIQTVKSVFTVILNYRSKFIISASSIGAYRLLKLMRFLRIKDVVYWVIGGDLPHLLSCNYLDKKPYMNIRTIIVEGDRMKESLRICGLENVITVPNFKPMGDVNFGISPMNVFPVKFVFLSRITEEKGCSYINSATKILNQKGLEKKFIVDFYGTVNKSYKDIFLQEIDNLPNVQYKGFLNLLDDQNYKILADYDVMLFPTFFYAEGFPGVLIDAFIAGLPVIVSDWNLNGEIINDGVTGAVVANRNVTKSASAMEDVINHREKYYKMRYNCLLERMKYDIDEIVTHNLLGRIGIK